MSMLPVLIDATSYAVKAYLDSYRSFIWTGRYYTPGDFQLILSPEAGQSIKIGDYIARGDASDEFGIVEKIQLGRDADGVETMTVTGRSLLAITERRIVADQTVLDNKTMTAAVSTLLTDALIAPVIAAREVSNFTHDAGTTIADRVTVQITGKNLLEALEDLCERTGTGQRVTLSGGAFVYKLYQGTDKHSTLIFSDRFDNLGAADYIENDTDTITDALVAGEGEGTARVTVWATEDSPSGLARREAYVDARDLSSDGGVIPQVDYEEQLRQRGLDALTHYTTALTADVYLPAGAYRSMVSLGDLVTVQNTRWGLSVTARLVEVTEITDETGAYTIRPTFGL